MAQRPDSELLTLFENDDQPSGNDFRDLINSKVNVADSILSTFGANIISYGGSGDSATGNYGALLAANNALVALGGGTIYFPNVNTGGSAYRVETNIAFDSKVQLHFDKGAYLAPDTTITVSNISLINPPLYKIFATGNGVVRFNSNIKELYPQWWGALANNSHDDTDAFNACIAAATAITADTVNRGAKIFIIGIIKVTSKITIPSGTKGLVFEGVAFVRGGSPTPPSQIVTTLANDVLFDLGNNINSNISFRYLGISGVSLAGGGTKDAHGIYALNSPFLHVHHCYINQFGGSGIKVTGRSLNMVDVLIDNCNLDYASFADYSGALDIGSGEAILRDCEVSGGIASGLHALAGSGYAVSIAVRGAGCRFEQVVAQFGQTGWYFAGAVGGDYTWLTDCRGEFNQREGYLVTKPKVHFFNCTATNNSQAVDNTYDGWSFASGAYSSKLHGCIVFGNSASYRQRYGFTDALALATDSLALANHYIDCGAPFGLYATTDTPPVGNRQFNFGTVFPPLVSRNEKIQVISTIAASPSSPPLTWQFDGELGDNWDFTVGVNESAVISAKNLLYGHTYTLRIVQHASAPTLTLDAAVFTKVVSFVSPAASKIQTFTFRCARQAQTLTQIGAGSGDM